MARVVAEHHGGDDDDGGGGLEAEERMLLGAVERLVEETHLERSLGPKKDGGRPCPGSMRRLSIAALRLWAQTCQGIQVYEIVHVVGKALSIAADSIERGL